MPFSGFVGDILQAVVIVIGAFVAGLVGGFLPSFAFSDIVYGILGLVVAAFGIRMHSHSAYIGSFLIGFGAVMAASLVKLIPIGKKA